MAIASYSRAASSEQVTRNYDGAFIAGYAVLALVALAAIYFASAGPGNGEAALATMVAMP